MGLDSTANLDSWFTKAVADAAVTTDVDVLTSRRAVERSIEPEVTRTATFLAEVCGSSEFSCTTIKESGFMRYVVPSGKMMRA